MSALRLVLVLLSLLSSGCLTLVRGTQGRPLDQATVDQIQRDKTTLPELLARLGAPHEVHNHADGRLLVYRHRATNTLRIGLSASQALRFVDASQVVAEAIGNLSFTLWRIHVGEDRLVVLIDSTDVVRGVGFRMTTPDLPAF